MTNERNPALELIYCAMEALDTGTGGNAMKVWKENGMAHLTVCPVCDVDDFMHIEDCPLYLEIEARTSPNK